MKHETGSTVAQEAQYIDHSVRPQDDLFGHVNGKWLERAEFRADLATIGGSSISPCRPRPSSKDPQGR